MAPSVSCHFQKQSSSINSEIICNCIEMLSPIVLYIQHLHVATLFPVTEQLQRADSDHFGLCDLVFSWSSPKFEECMHLFNGGVPMGGRALVNDFCC